jgi:hypothetical protein
METLLAPSHILEEIAQERGWRDSEGETPTPEWHRGMTQEVDGKTQIHAAAIPVNDPKGELKRRIWTAQVSVMLPFVEEQRREFIEEYSRFLSVPYTTPLGEKVETKSELEINHLYLQVVNGIPVDAATVRHVDRLKNIRNRLAHLGILDEDLIP